MIERVACGELPRKHHLAFRDASGALRHEECFTRAGFDGAYTIAYHVERPHTQRVAAPRPGFTLPEEAPAQRLAKRHFHSSAAAPRGTTPTTSRTPLLFNDDVVLSVMKPSTSDDACFANGDADDLYFIFRGGGVLHSMLGALRFDAEDYVYVPRGLAHRFELDAGPQEWLSMELPGGMRVPTQWRNDVGQLRMDAPYCHRDFRRPTFHGPTEAGTRELLVKRNGAFHAFRYEHNPFDVVGWDGAVYPFAFPILNFQPRAGLVHLPPDWHGTFATRGALICSFVPRAVDFHPEAIPCPYPHSSVDCDEFLFYVRGNFTSRRGVGPGSISFHPAGIPHGPHPGAYEASLGARETSELAVMLDTFKPLRVTPHALAIEDPNYMESFLR